jgi:hypothetical protein
MERNTFDRLTTKPLE